MRLLVGDILGQVWLAIMRAPINRVRASFVVIALLVSTANAQTKNVHELYDYGIQLLQRGEYDTAISIFTTVLATPERSSLAAPTSDAAIYSYIGDAYVGQLDYRGAVRAYRTSIGLSSAADRWVARYQVKLAQAMWSFGDFDSGFDLIRSAVTSLEAENPQVGDDLAAAYVALSSIYVRKFDPLEGRRYVEKAIKLIKTDPNKQNQQLAETYSALGSTYLEDMDNQGQTSLTNCSLALGAFKTALSVYENIFGKEHFRVAQENLEIGKAYLCLRQFPNALTFVTKATSMLESVLGSKNIHIAEAYLWICSTYYQMDFAVKAEEFCKISINTNEEVLGIAHPKISRAYYLLSFVYRDLKDIEKGAVFSIKAFDSFLKSQEILFEESDYTSKITFKNNNEDSISYLENMLLSIDDKSVSNGTRRAALNLWLSNKGAATAYISNLSSIYMRSSPEVRLKIDKYRTLRRDLSYANSKQIGISYSFNDKNNAINAIVQQINIIEREFGDFLLKIKENLSTPRISVKDIAGYLEPGELYIDFVWNFGFPYVFVLDKDENVHFTMAEDFNGGEVVEKLVTKLAESLRDGRSLEMTKLTRRELFNDLIGPIKRQIRDATRLVISPDGLINFLPFEVLTDGRETLIERYTIRYVPSGREFLRLHKVPRTQDLGPPAVFGNPDFGISAPVGFDRGSPLTERDGGLIFAALPGTEQEARSVANLLQHNVQTFIGPDANEQVLFGLAKPPRFLHLATHGFFLRDDSLPNPLLRVGIALAGADRSVRSGFGYGLLNGLLLANLNLLGTELVVLSACDTGLGELIDGEGVSGLAQAFFTAGAQRVLLSLWKVPDAETSVFMIEFYRRLVAGFPPEEALRGAKLASMKQGISPRTWAAFVLSGF